MCICKFNNNKNIDPKILQLKIDLKKLEKENKDFKQKLSELNDLETNTEKQNEAKQQIEEVLKN
jgi:hypothetical protein